MGTRSLTFVYNYDKPVMCLYRQYDGYQTGHGKQLAEFLNSIEAVTNGISGTETRRIANGMDCLAAQIVAHFKRGVGDFYLLATDTEDAHQEFEYHVYEDKVLVKDYRGVVIFKGSWSEFGEYCQDNYQDVA